MFDRKFNIIRILIIIVTSGVLVGILVHENKAKPSIDKKTEVNKDTVIEVTKRYVNDHPDFFNEILKEDIEYRLDTNILFNELYMAYNNDSVGYVSIKNNEYTYVPMNNFLIDKIVENNSLVKEENDEGLPFDLDYIYKGNPNNYIIYKDNEYRIIGFTNSKHLKLVSTSKETIENWGNSGNINYFSGDKEENEDGSKGIFYVGFIRSEVNDLSQIVKNEKRNNYYTKILPRYYGYSSYINVSDIINASEDCNFKNILDINKNNCDSYLLDMISNTYTSNTLDNNLVYYIDNNYKLKGNKLEKNINVNRVIYVQGISKYISGNGSKDDPYIFE